MLRSPRVLAVLSLLALAGLLAAGCSGPDASPKKGSGSKSSHTTDSK